MSESPRHARLTSRPFPPYTYVPGQAPHPLSDPKGHSFGTAEVPPEPLVPERWRQNETYLYAIDLFNSGYYWEAHEAWETLWHAADRRGPVADLLKGLIKLAAAGVKLKENNDRGAARHANRAGELLAAAEAAFGKESVAGLHFANLYALRDAAARGQPMLQIVVT